MRSIFSFIVLLIVMGCKKTDLPPHRSFQMTMTPWPPDFNQVGKKKAYDFINNHCDLICQHFDEGIPYEEALNQSPFSDAFTADLSERKKNSPKKVFLSIAALDISRKNKAGYHILHKPSQEIINKWSSLEIDDSLTIQAYTQYVLRLMDEFDTEFVNFGVESNHGEWSPTQILKYRHFLKKVYQNLKATHPQIPFFISNMISLDSTFLENAKIVSEYSDYLGVSFYPYTYLGSPVYGEADPRLIPTTLLDNYRNIDSTKPFVIAETGFIAEDLDLQLIHKKSNPEYQYYFLNYLFNYCQQHNSPLFNYFCAYDYDAGIRTFNALGYQNELPKIWQNIGLIDEQNRKRPSYTLWNSYFQLP